MVQLWVNLPARDKMAPPAYQGITAAETLTVEWLDTGGASAGTARLIAGALMNRLPWLIDTGSMPEGNMFGTAWMAAGTSDMGARGLLSRVGEARWCRESPGTRLAQCLKPDPGL
jgi:hypothetical protein